MSGFSSGDGRLQDLEAGPSKDNNDLNTNLDPDADTSDPFDIDQTKNATPQTLKRWRQAALVLNASRRFRYTLDLRKQEEKEQRKRMIRAHAQVIRAALLFKLAGEKGIVSGTPVTLPGAAGDFAVGLEQLASMTRDHKLSALQQYGGVKGLSDLLKTNLETGIYGDEVDLLNHKTAFGSNTYPRKKGRSFWRFLWEAWQDLTLIILVVAASVSLGLGIKTENMEKVFKFSIMKLDRNMNHILITSLMSTILDMEASVWLLCSCICQMLKRGGDNISKCQGQY